VHRNPKWNPYLSAIGQYNNSVVHLNSKAKNINAIVLEGVNLENLSPLAYYNFSYLKLRNTGIKDLRFLNSLTNKELTISLESNHKILDFSPLCNDSIDSLGIENQQFSDTSVISPKTKTIFLHDTYINKLNFIKPAAIEKIYLSKNKKLDSWDQIAEMKNLKLFSGSNLPTSFDYQILSCLNHLEDIGLDNSNIKIFPKLKKQNLKFISLSECCNLENLSNLTGKTICNLWIYKVNEDALKTIGKCTILKILVVNTQLNDLRFMEDISGIEKITVRSKSLKTIDSLKDKNIKDLSVSNSAIEDISVLKGMPLIKLNIEGTMVTDISPLIGMNLEYLNIKDTPAAKTPFPDGIIAKTLIK
jgi:hypothetical protein